MNTSFQQQIDNLRRNPKISKALEVFEHAQKTYEQAMEAITLKRKDQSRGTYSSSISKKEYYANKTKNPAFAGKFGSGIAQCVDPG